MKQEDLYTFLCTWMTPGKIQKFEKIAALRTRHLVLVAEDIYQSQNASALLRTAECCGIQDVYVIENNNSFELKKRVVKGAADWLTIHRYNDGLNNSQRCFDELKAKGYKIAVTSPHEDDYTLSNIPLDHRLAVVMGSELKGASGTALKCADYTVTIPMSGFTESLNVSVATGLVLYEMGRRLRSSKLDWQLSFEEQLELKINWAKKSIQSSAKLLELFERGEFS